MKHYFLLIFSVPFFVLSSCNKKRDEPKPYNPYNVYPLFPLEKEDTLSDAEYKVYSDFFSAEIKSAGNVNLAQQTNYWNSIPNNFPLDTVRKTHGGFDSTIFVNYNKINQKAYVLGNKIKIPSAKVVLIPTSELIYYFSHKDPLSQDGLNHSQGLYEKYSGGYYTISRVGFNADKTEAVMSVSISSAPQNAYGYTALLKKLNDNWVVIYEMNGWMS
ncbi:MAG: hypothetical protein H7329_02485 [Opitutaceae bacterium]|nr:hypothetical protein [Cytophagales bacterium]